MPGVRLPGRSRVAGSVFAEGRFCRAESRLRGRAAVAGAGIAFAEGRFRREAPFFLHGSPAARLPWQDFLVLYAWGESGWFFGNKRIFCTPGHEF